MPVLCGPLVRWIDGDMDERNPEVAHVLSEVRVVGDYHRDVVRQLSAALMPQEVEKAMVGLGHEDGDALAIGGAGERALCLVGLSDPGLKLGLERGSLGGKVLQMELGPLDRDTEDRQCSVTRSD